MDLFMRKIELNAGGKLFGLPLTIYFDVAFDDSEKINTATFKVYNLSDGSIAGIINNSVATLTAGYEGDVGQVFQGIVKDAKTAWQGVDKITQIECADEHADYLKNKVVKTFAPGTSSSVILRFLISEAGLKMGDFSPVNDFTYRNGKVLKGNVSALLKEVVKDSKSKMHIHRGKIYIRDAKKGDETGFVVNKDSGLIDHPEKIETETEKKDSKEKEKRTGWKVKMLLNHRITVDSIIVLQSKVVSGTFRVVKGRHYCEGNSFYTEVEVY